MAWLQADAPNIQQGWGGPPQLHAAETAGLVASILRNRQQQQQMTQENIATAIKQMQEQRQSQAYLDAAQKAGILPEGDYSGLGVKGATLLAQEIQKKKLADSLIARRGELSTHGGRGGGGAGGSAAPETTWDEQGREWRRGPGGRWIPIKAPASQTAATPKLSPTEKGWAAPDIPGLSVNVNAPNEDVQTLQPDVPPASDVSPPPTGAGSADTLAPGYGAPAGDMSADDIRAAFKAGKMTVEEATARLKAIGFSD